MSMSYSKKIYIAAEGFRTIGWNLATTLPENVVQYCVVSALALELYLKCAISLDSGKKRVQDHNHTRLFARLSKESQSDIISLFESNPSVHRVNAAFWQTNPELDLSFHHRLRLGQDAFTYFRYAYEESSATPSSWLSGEITEAVRMWILKKYGHEVL